MNFKAGVFGRVLSSFFVFLSAVVSPKAFSMRLIDSPIRCIQYLNTERKLGPERKPYVNLAEIDSRSLLPLFEELKKSEKFERSFLETAFNRLHEKIADGSATFGDFLPFAPNIQPELYQLRVIGIRGGQIVSDFNTLSRRNALFLDYEQQLLNMGEQIFLILPRLEGNYSALQDRLTGNETLSENQRERAIKNRDRFVDRIADVLTFFGKLERDRRGFASMLNLNSSSTNNSTSTVNEKLTYIQLEAQKASSSSKGEGVLAFDTFAFSKRGLALAGQKRLLRRSLTAEGETLPSLARIGKLRAELSRRESSLQAGEKFFAELQMQLHLNEKLARSTPTYEKIKKSPEPDAQLKEVTFDNAIEYLQASGFAARLAALTDIYKLKTAAYLLLLEMIEKELPFSGLTQEERDSSGLYKEAAQINARLSRQYSDLMSQVEKRVGEILEDDAHLGNYRPTLRQLK